MKESSRQKTIALKKASKIYKQRLKHFTGDMENLTSQIRDRVSIYTFFVYCPMYLVYVVNVIMLNINLILLLMLLTVEKLYSVALVFILKDYIKCHICILKFISLSLGTLLKDILNVSQSI